MFKTNDTLNEPDNKLNIKSFVHPNLPGMFIDLNQFKHCYLGKFPCLYKAFQNTKENKPLFDHLDSWGFFDFHNTNSKQLVYYHQVIAFMRAGGYQAFQNGFICRKGEVEIHHLNGDTKDNRPENLQYITCDQHEAITKHQRSVHRYLRHYRKSSYLLHKVQKIWNRKGQQIFNLKKFLCNLILKTVLLTASRNGIVINFKEIPRWYRKLRQIINVNGDGSFLPNFFLYLNTLETHELIPELQFTPS